VEGPIGLVVLEVKLVLQLLFPEIIVQLEAVRVPEGQAVVLQDWD